MSLFPWDVLDEIWDEIESISEVFITYSYTPEILKDFMELFYFKASLLNKK